MLRSGFLSLLILTFTFLSGCGDDENTLRVGTMAGPESDLVDVAKEIAKEKYSLNIKVLSFTDYSLPNTALADGSIDVNVFQHAPYLEVINKTRDYNLVSVGQTFIYPMGLYSKRIQKLSDLPLDATIAIPNDPTNKVRALHLLAKAGLIKLSNSDDFIDLHNIIENPKQLRFKALNAGQLPRALDDVDIAAINTNYALASGLSPTKDSLYKEEKDSNYANIVVVRAADQDNESIKMFLDAMHSPAVVAKAKELFGENAIIAW